jgi:hypothetical protein
MILEATTTRRGIALEDAARASKPPRSAAKRRRKSEPAPQPVPAAARPATPRCHLAGADWLAYTPRLGKAK